MRLSPDLCPKCGDELPPSGSPCQLCALRCRNNFFIGVGALCCIGALVAFVSSSQNAPPVRVVTRPVVVTPAPAVTPLVIPDAPANSGDGLRGGDEIKVAPRVLARPKTNQTLQISPETKAQKVQVNMQKLVQIARNTESISDLIEFQFHVEMTQVDVRAEMRKALSEDNDESYRLNRAIYERLEALESAIELKTSNYNGQKSAQIESLFAQAVSP